MHRLRLLLALLLLLPLAAQAGVTLVVNGVDDPLEAAVRSGVELTQYATRPVSEAQIWRLYEAAPGQVRSALEPYGYYDTSVQGSLARTGTDDWRVVLTIAPGEPVRVTAVQVALDPAAKKIASIRRAERGFERLSG
jgi:translocation and assembly module TamA